jgi:hypothetical protein
MPTISSRLLSPLLIAVYLLLVNSLEAQTNLLDDPTLETRMLEERGWLANNMQVFSPNFWIRYGEKLYFQPKTDALHTYLEKVQASKKRYTILTNRLERYQIIENVIINSGLSNEQQHLLLEPITKGALFPAWHGGYYSIAKYKVLQSLEGGDALIQDGDDRIYYVYNHGRVEDDAYYRDACLVKEGLKTYTTAIGGTKTVQAYTDVSLLKSDEGMLLRVAYAFQRRINQVDSILAAIKDRKQFRQYQQKADSGEAVYQYLLGKAYMEGKGTETNRQLGIEWLERSAPKYPTAKDYLSKLQNKRGGQ